MLSLLLSLFLPMPKYVMLDDRGRSIGEQDIPSTGIVEKGVSR